MPNTRATIEPVEHLKKLSDERKLGKFGVFYKHLAFALLYFGLATEKLIRKRLVKNFDRNFGTSNIWLAIKL